MKIRMVFGLTLFVLALILTACGGGNSTAAAGQTSSAASQPEPPSMSKAALIREGDAICTKTDAKQRAALKSYEKEHPVKPTSKAGVEASFRVAAFPPIATEIQELESLGAPADDKVKVDAILSGLQSALKTAEAKPSTLLGLGEGPFAAPDKVAAAYGFKACAEAL